MELQSLNPKQLLKEFKATQKDVKSKDALLKEGALKKCADNTRYFTEGGCLVPLVLSIAPKKVLCVCGSTCVVGLSCMGLIDGSLILCFARKHWMFQSYVSTTC